MNWLRRRKPRQWAAFAAWVAIMVAMVVGEALIGRLIQGLILVVLNILIFGVAAYAGHKKLLG